MLNDDKIAEGAYSPPRVTPSLYESYSKMELPWTEDPIEEVGMPDDMDAFWDTTTPPKTSPNLYDQFNKQNFTEVTDSLPDQTHTIPLEDLFPQDKKTSDKLLEAIRQTRGQDEKMECVQEVFNRKALGVSTIKDIALDELNIMVIDEVLNIKIGVTWYGTDESGFDRYFSSKFPEFTDGLSNSDLKKLYKRIMIAPSVHITSRDLDAKPNLIPCLDGVYDIMTGKSYDSDRGKDFRYCVNVRARAIKDGPCCSYENYLEKSFGDMEAARICYEQCQGVTLSGYTPRNVLAYVGPTGCGKSVSANLLIRLLTNNTGYGSEMAFIKSLDDPNRLSGNFGLGDLPGKQLCYCGDTAKVPIKESTCAVLKQLSGGDLIRGEQKYRDSFEFVNHAKILFLSNNPLRGAIDDALRDRIVVVPFSATIPASERIPHYDEILYEERGCIVYRYMQALRGLIESNFEFEYVPGSEEWIKGSAVGPNSSVESFVAQMCVLDPQAYTSVGTLYQTYMTFCDRARYSPITDRAQFGKQLLGTCPTLQPQRDSKSRGYRGIALRQGS